MYLLVILKVLEVSLRVSQHPLHGTDDGGWRGGEVGDLLRPTVTAAVFQLADRDLPGLHINYESVIVIRDVTYRH